MKEVRSFPLDGLIMMKQLAGRPRDLVDIERLNAAARGEKP